MYAGSWWGDLRERNHLEDLGADGRKVLRWIVGGGDKDWLELAQDRDRCWALVSAVMNLRVP